MNVKSGQTKARGACIFSLPRGKLARRAPCIYRTAAFENRTIGKTLGMQTQQVQDINVTRFRSDLSARTPCRQQSV